MEADINGAILKANRIKTFSVTNDGAIHTRIETSRRITNSKLEKHHSPFEFNPTPFRNKNMYGQRGFSLRAGLLIILMFSLCSAFQKKKSMALCQSAASLYVFLMHPCTFFEPVVSLRRFG